MNNYFEFHFTLKPNENVGQQNFNEEKGLNGTWDSVLSYKLQIAVPMS